MAATATTIPAPAGRARWTRLIPVTIIVYVISFMDRTNIGFAFDGMGKDLHLDSAAQGLAGGIFFIGYLVLQIPGRNGARNRVRPSSLLNGPDGHCGIDWELPGGARRSW